MRAERARPFFECNARYAAVRGSPPPERFPLAGFAALEGRLERQGRLSPACPDRFLWVLPEGILLARRVVGPAVPGPLGEGVEVRDAPPRAGLSWDLPAHFPGGMGELAALAREGRRTAPWEAAPDWRLALSPGGRPSLQIFRGADVPPESSFNRARGPHHTGGRL